MIRRWLELQYFQHREKRSAAQIGFWFHELRTPLSLLEPARTHTLTGRRLALQRPLLADTTPGDATKLDPALAVEEAAARESDRVYWLPQRHELERLRHPK